VKVADEPLPATGRTIGIDWGVSAIATTTTDAFDLPHREHGKSAARKLAHYQKMMARRKPAPGKEASRGYEVAKRQTARLHRQVARQRQDDARKWAKSVVRTFDQVAVEDFSSKFLSKSTMAKKAADAAISATRTELSSMATKHRRELVYVPPAHTTMDCSNCGARAKHRLGLSQRIFACTTCGNVMHRDKNAAANMVARAGFVPAGVESVRPEPQLVAQAV
jgi:putative transposase